jgi:hypothetical protein
VLRLFVEHPASVGETYGQHWRFASLTGITLIGAGCACLIHGTLPFLFTTTGSRTIRKLAEKVGKRAASPDLVETPAITPAKTTFFSRRRKSFSDLRSRVPF